MITCYYCKKEIDLSQDHIIIGVPPLGVSVHDDCLEQWKKEDPQEFEGKA